MSRVKTIVRQYGSTTCESRRKSVGLNVFDNKPNDLIVFLDLFLALF